MKHTIISLIISSSVLGLASCTTTESSMGYRGNYVSANTYSPPYSAYNNSYGAGYNRVGYYGNGYNGTNYYGVGYNGAGYYGGDYNYGLGYANANRGYYANSNGGHWNHNNWNNNRGYKANGVVYKQGTSNYYHNGLGGKNINAMQYPRRVNRYHHAHHENM